MNKINIGVLLNPKKDIKTIPKKDVLCTYHFEKFNSAKFTKIYKEYIDKVSELLINIKDEDIVEVLTDLYTNNKIKLGGCSLSGATIKATQVSVIHISCKQLIRQIKETIKSEKDGKD